MSASLKLISPPPSSDSFLISVPATHILLVTINRVKFMNALPSTSHWEAHQIFDWYDNEPSLRVAIVTGAGEKAFCAGQDLIEQARFKSQEPTVTDIALINHPPSGFAGISRRAGKKPIIAAVNGYALGGGFEICLNCDLVIASPTATFGLPEASRGIYAAAGGLPRLIRTCGLQLASEVALTGRNLTAYEAQRFGLVNHVSSTPQNLIPDALDWANRILKLSPDAVIITRAALRYAWESPSVERATSFIAESYASKLRNSENMKIGLLAFAQKQTPKWQASKL